MPAKKPVKLVDTDQVLALAAQVYRLQGGYTKGSDSRSGPVFPANKVRLAQLLEQGVEPTEQDRAQAIEIHGRAQGLIFQALSRGLSDFDQTINRLVLEPQTNVLDPYSLAILSYTPAWLAKCRDKDQQEDLLRSSQQSYLGAIGQKVEADITVVKSVFSINYGVYFVTALTDSRHQVFFSYRDNLSSGRQLKIKGTIKAHRDGFRSQLTRAKIV